MSRSLTLLIGFNTALRGIHTTLLKKSLEQEIGQAFAPATNYSNSQQVPR
jgi:hypothetical protein